MLRFGPWPLVAALCATCPAFATGSWTFANKETLSVILSGEHSGVHWGRHAGAHPLIQGPLRETGYERTTLRFLSHRGLIATNDDGLFVIHQSGQVRAIPTLRAPARNASREIVWHGISAFNHQGQSFLVLHLKWHDPVAIGPTIYDGELVIIRDDGLSLRFGVTVDTDPPGEAVWTDEGLFRVPGYPRMVDIDRFELEASVQTGIPRRASSGQQSFVPAWDLAVESFPMIKLPADDRRAGPATAAAIAGGLKSLAGDKRSVVLRGPEGVGKEFALRGILRGLPRGWTAFDVSPDAVTSTAGVFGNYESRLLAMKAASETRPVVWVLRNIHAFRGTGVYMNKPTDFFDGVLPEIKNGTLRVIGIADDAQYAALVRGRTDLRNALDVVPVASADKQVVGEHVADLVERSGVAIQTGTLNRLRGWVERFGPRTSEPGRTLGVLKAATKLASERGVPRVDLADVRGAVERRFEVPGELLDHDRAVAKLASIETNLAARLPGNDVARNAVLAAARAKLFNLREANRPRATGLLLGPKGSGKTALIENYAREMNLPFLPLAMSNFPHPFQSEKFTRAVGEFLDAHPHGIVFLDELDKCATEVQDALLKALESNAMSYIGDQGLTSVSIANAQVFGASNAGEDMIMTAAVQGRGVGEDALRSSLSGRLSAYLIDRMDFVAPVFPSAPQVYRMILRDAVDRALDFFGIPAEHIANYGEMIDRLVAERPAHGSNREAERAVSRGIRDAVGDLLATRRVAHPDDLPSLRYRYDQRLELDCERALAPVSEGVLRPTFGRARGAG